MADRGFGARRFAVLSVFISLVVLAVGLFPETVMAVAAQDSTVSGIDLSSPVVKAGETIPLDYTHIGKDISPPLAWSGLPQGTVELALIMEGPFEGQPEPIVHWVLYRIPATVTGLPERLPRVGTHDEPKELVGVQEGYTTWRNPGYRGPAVGSEPATYAFRLYAIDADLGLVPGLDKEGLLAAIDGHVLARGELRFIAQR